MSQVLIKKLFRLLGGGHQRSILSNQQASGEKLKLSKDLMANLSTFRETLGNSMDVEIRLLAMGQTQVGLIYLEGIVDRTALRENVIRALMVDTHTTGTHSDGKSGIAHSLKEKIISVCCVKESKDFKKLVHAVLSGFSVVLVDGDDTGLILKLPGYESRTITEPLTEQVVRGPREGFVESISTNVSLIRRKIRSPDIRFERMVIGRVTRTDVCIVFIKGIVNPDLVEEVKKRLRRIEIDGVLESGYLEELIKDSPYSFFPTVGNTEKPDKAAAQLLEGRIVIITDGTPFVLSVPYLFIESLHTSEDYYSSYYSASFFRILRFVFFIITTSLPALYVAISSFNPEVLPVKLLLTLKESREGVFLPAIGEVLLMGFVFEALREAGVRLPRNVGQAVSIVGALVIGQAAVTAGLVSAVTVIITALTGIAAFVLPSQAEALLFQRIIYTLLSGFLGFYGLFLGYAFMLVHTVNLRSLGVPYLSPVAPLTKGDMKDTLVRTPWWKMRARPEFLHGSNIQRQGKMPAPGPDEDN